MKEIRTDYKRSINYLRETAVASPDVSCFAPPQREAEIFRRILMEIPIGKLEGESLAGDYGMSFAAAGFRDRVEAAHIAPGPVTASSNTPFTILAQQYGCRSGFSPAHTTVCYDLLVQKGMNGIIAEIENDILAADSECREYLTAEIAALRSVIAWSERYAKLSFEQCNRVPAEPPRNFHEALQAVWLVHTAIGIGEKNDASLSLGRIDQYLYPFYRDDLVRGVPETQLEAVLSDFFLKLNRYGDAACAVNLGGVDSTGKDMFNDLTRLIVKVATGLQLPSPILAARIHPGISQEDFDSLTIPELFRIGQPSFYGEFSCRHALLERGVDESEVHRWTVNSCMGLMMSGEEFSDMWGVVFTFLLPLELALNHGQPFHGRLPFKLHTAPPEDYADTSEIMNTTAAYAGELLKILTARHREITACEGKNNPDPYVSALLRGGTPGKDRLLGGPRYHTVNVDAFALVNAADAITAINQVVFQRRSHTLAELVAAAINNFSGQEALRLELLTAPKYGNDNREADQNVRKLAARFAAVVRDCSDEKMIYMPSFHTLNAHVGAGASWGAGLDGRLAGEPFAKNIGPMQGRNINGITSVITSATAIEQEFFYGGQALDLHVDAGLFDAYSDRVKLQAALQTYFKQGGLLIQINGGSVETLKKALVEPEMYADLTVRIGGYSTRFVLLSREIQREMIKRFESHT